MKAGRPAVLLMLILLLPALLAPGCWDQREPQDQAIILGLAIDFIEETALYEVFVETAIPSALAGAEGGSQGGGGPVSQVLGARGYTIFEALRDLEPLSPRELYWGDSELVIFSETLARQGLAPVLDFFERERHSRMTSRPLVARNDLQELLRVDLPLEDTAGLGFLSQIITQELSSASVPAVDLRRVVMMLSQPGIEVFLPQIRLAGGEGGAGGGGAGGSGGGAEAQPPAQVVRIESGAAFKGDRLAGWLGPEATRGWLWITGNINRATESVPCPVCDGFSSIEVIHYTHSLEAVIEAGKPKVIVRLNADSRIQDLNCKHPFAGSREEIISTLNSRMAEAIRRKMELALAEARALQSDIFGFGREFYRRHPRWWSAMEKDWPFIFQDLPVELQVQVNLRRIGLILDPVEVR
ncbi:MAG TPA: Ger(x)C family spore germination protein [Bacillota bacterium]|nr:Ger(x)C family spore germination protein [Bacillota bacterium]